MNNLRVIFVGGQLSFRGLFNWLSPWIYVPVFLVWPTMEIAFFTYMGRAAELESDRFYVIGGALLATSVPCLFAMSNTLTGERRYQTLQYLVASPASRLAVYFGRALPVIVNAFVVSGFALAVSTVLFNVRMSAGSWGLLALCIFAAAFSATGLGLVCGAICLRGREAAVLGNVFAVVLLLLCGATVPLHTLPGWMRALSHVMPLTHAIGAAREAAAGASLHAISGLLGTELALGAVYGAIGIAMLYAFETSARRRATIDLI